MSDAARTTGLTNNILHIFRNGENRCIKSRWHPAHLSPLEIINIPVIVSPKQEKRQRNSLLILLAALFSMTPPPPRFRSFYKDRNQYRLYIKGQVPPTQLRKKVRVNLWCWHQKIKCESPSPAEAPVQTKVEQLSSRWVTSCHSFESFEWKRKRMAPIDRSSSTSNEILVSWWTKLWARKPDSRSLSCC